MKITNAARVIIYGAVSRVPAQVASKIDKLKNSIHLAMDRIAAKLGRVQRINYKNYERPWTYNRGDLAIADAVQASLATVGCNAPTIRINWDELSKVNLTEQDIVIVAGSGYIHPDKKGALPSRVFSDYEAIRQSGCRVALIGIGVNVLLDWDHSKATSLTLDSRKVLDDLLNLCSLITVRDEQSQNFIRRLGPHRLSIIGDPALFLAEQSQKSITTKSSTGIRIGLSIPFHGIEPTEWIQKNIKDFTAFLVALQKSKQISFDYFLHYDSERLVYEVMKDCGLDVNLIDGNTQELLQAYQRLDLHIGGMLHSCIMASSQRTPTIALAYDTKHFGFFKLLERDEFCIYNQSIDYKRLTELIEKTIEDQVNQRLQLDNRIKLLEVNYMDAISKAVKAI